MNNHSIISLMVLSCIVLSISSGGIPSVSPHPSNPSDQANPVIDLIREQSLSHLDCIYPLTQFNSTHQTIMDEWYTSLSHHQSTPRPLILIHLTIGGRIHGLRTLPPLYYRSSSWNHTSLFGSYSIHQITGVLPVYVGVSTHPVILTVIDPTSNRCSTSIYQPFYEIMVPCIGTSTAWSITTAHHSSSECCEVNLDLCLYAWYGGVSLL